MYMYMYVLQANDPVSTLCTKLRIPLASEYEHKLTHITGCSASSEFSTDSLVQIEAFKGMGFSLEGYALGCGNF